MRGDRWIGEVVAEEWTGREHILAATECHHDSKHDAVDELLEDFVEGV